MKLIFDDKSFIEIVKSNSPGKIIITVSAKDRADLNKKITNSVELTEDQIKSLIGDLNLVLDDKKV